MAMFGRIGGVPLFGKIRARNPKFIKNKKRPEFLCSEKEIKIKIF